MTGRFYLVIILVGKFCFLFYKLSSRPQLPDRAISPSERTISPDKVRFHFQMILFLKPHIHRLDGGNFNCYNLYQMGWYFEKDKAVENCSQANRCNQAFVQLCYCVFCCERCNMDFWAEHNKTFWQHMVLFQRCHNNRTRRCACNNACRQSAFNLSVNMFNSHYCSSPRCNHKLLCWKHKTPCWREQRKISWWPRTSSRTFKRRTDRTFRKGEKVQS